MDTFLKVFFLLMLGCGMLLLIDRSERSDKVIALLESENDSLRQELINCDSQWYRITRDTIYPGDSLFPLPLDFGLPPIEEKTYKRWFIDSFSYRFIEKATIHYVHDSIKE